MNPETDEIWPPTPSTPEVDTQSFRTSSVELSILDDVLLFRLRFFRSFLKGLAFMMALIIPLSLIAAYFQDYSLMPPTFFAIRNLYAGRMTDFISLVCTTLGSLLLLLIVYEMMFLRAQTEFVPESRVFRAGLWRHSLDGLQYIEIRPQVSKTKTWTRWGFFLGFDHAVAARFDSLNPLHRLAAWYAGAERNEYYLGYTADPGGALRAGRAIARFLDVEFRGVDN